MIRKSNRESGICKENEGLGVNSGGGDGGGLRGSDDDIESSSQAAALPRKG
jgi:hypothetical protein